jgi:hypothetical protein
MNAGNLHAPLIVYCHGGSMLRHAVAASLVAAVAVIPLAAQTKKAPNTITYDITINADGKPYTGTMALAVSAGKVTGNMHVTAPTEITGKAAGTAKAGKMDLDFPYRMVERACDGQIAMAITLPEKKGAAPATGTVSIGGCGRPDSNKLTGTIELTPQAAAKKKQRHFERQSRIIGVPGGGP